LPTGAQSESNEFLTELKRRNVSVTDYQASVTSDTNRCIKIDTLQTLPVQ
jgi:hypothetical protein